MTANDFQDFDTAAFWQEPDFILTELVSLMANRMNAELGITLMIGGAVLTGTLVGERDYLAEVGGVFRRITRDMIDRPTPEDLRAIDEAFMLDEMAEDSYPADEDEPADAEPAAPASPSTNGSGPHPEAPQDEQLLPPIRFLHLKDPIIIAPGSTMSFRDSALPIMRIRLSQVEGWMLGRVTMMSPDEYDSYDDDDESPRYRPGGFIQ